MGRLHAEKLKPHLVAVIDPAGVSEGLPRAHEVPPGIDAAVVAVPAAQHFEVALPLLQAGLPTLVEKPLAAELEQARVLAAFPRLCVNHLERFNPAMAALPGQVHHISAQRMAPYMDRGTDVDVVLDLMIHDLDLVLRLLGPVHEVRAVGLRFDEGRVRLDLAARKAWRLVAGGQPEPIPVPEYDALDAVHRAFLRAVVDKAEMPIPGREALEAMELAIRVRRTIGGRD